MVSLSLGRIVGTTETRDLEIGHALVMSGEHHTPKWQLKADGFKWVLLPKAILEQGNLTIGGSDLNAVRDGAMSLFIFGFAKYRDAFDNKHLTLACYRLIASPLDYTRKIFEPACRSATNGISPRRS